MSLRPTRSPHHLLFAAAILAAGCAADPGSISQPLIMDQLHNGGTEGFLFLPPMVPKPAKTGDIVPGLPVTVQVDEIDANGKPLRTVATFTGNSGPKSERVRYHVTNGPADVDDNDGDLDPIGYYLARWKTNDEDLSLSATYRARVLVTAKGGGLRELGFADVDLVRNQKQFRSVDRQEFTPLINGDTLRIKFRVDRPAVDWDVDGVLDWNDNCPRAANPDQRDSLGNGIGDACRCDTLPADFGGIHCTASFASCDAKGGNVLHDFAGKVLERDGQISVACTSDAPVVDPTLGTTLHSAPMVVFCDSDIAFNLDLSLGPGVHRAKCKRGDKSYELRFDHSFGTDGTACAGNPKSMCGRVRSEVHVALEDLRAQGLANCRLLYAATATPGAGSVENGRLVGRGASYPVVAFDGVRLTGAGAELSCALHPLDGKTLAGAASQVRTRCGETAESAGPETRLGALCGHQLEGGKTVDRNAFADLHVGYEDPQPDPIGARLGRVGQMTGAVCPGVVPSLNQSESFVVARAPGALKATASVRQLIASPTMLDYYRKNVAVSVAVKGDGLPALEVAKGLSVADLEKGVPLSVPAEYASAANPSTVIRGGIRPGSPPSPVFIEQIICITENGERYCVIMDVDTVDIDLRIHKVGGGGPIEKPDLDLCVEVK